MVNKVIIVGNLGRDPEVRTTPSGQPVANFSVATTRKWKDREGNLQEKTEWHDIVCWGRQAESRRPVPDQGQAGLRRGPARDPLLGRQDPRRQALPHRDHLRQLPDARPQG